MKKAIIILFAFCTLASLYAQESEATTYFFIRHAEKTNDGTKNPHLSIAGQERAENWANILEFEEINAVYSTDYFRTSETAQPIAKARKLEVVKYDPRAFDLAKFINNTKGKKVLVVGHSNTTPIYVNAILNKEKYKQIEENVYGNLYIVTLNNGLASSILIKLE